MIKYKRILANFTFLLFLIVGVNFANAQQSNIPFSVEPILPENQVEETRGFFNLNVYPGDVVPLQVKVTNRRDEDITIRMQSGNGYTNPRGGMLYAEEIESENTEILDEAVKLAPHIIVDDEITIPTGESADVEIEVHVPEDRELGQVLGAVIFTSQSISQSGEEEADAEEENANVRVETETAVALAIQLNLPQKDELQFDFGSVNFNGSEAQIILEMFNLSSMIQPNLDGNIVVHNEAKDLLFEDSFGPMNMAPMTRINYPFDWGARTLEAGTYYATITANVNEAVIEEERTFVIEGEEIDEYMERQLPEVVMEKNNQIPMWTWILLGTVIVLLLVVIVLLLVRRK